MKLEQLTALLTPANSKIVLLVMDGLGGLPLTADGLTELETAKTPHMDRLAKEGALGQINPIGPGITPGSGPAHLSLFGIDPVEHEVGRGVLESIGVDVPVLKGDVAARGNFCTVDSVGNITDRRAGRIASADAANIVESLKTIKLEGVDVEIKHVKEHRFAIVLRGKDLISELYDTDPQREGVPPFPVKAKTPAAERTADLFNKWISQAREILADQPRANALTLRGFATDPGLPSYEDVYGLKAACVAVYPMYRGVSQLVGMDVVHFEGETPSDEFKALAGAWDKYDFFFVHIKKTDSYGEDGNFEGKVKVIESVDQALPELLALKPDVLIITGDHSTPAKMKSHSFHPVPFLLWAPGTVRPDQQAEFGERACLHGGLGNLYSMDTMPLALAHANRLNKFGA